MIFLSGRAPGLCFEIMPSNIRWSYGVLLEAAGALARRYPFLRFASIGKSVMGRDILTAAIGSGQNEVFYNAAHHANEWITTPVLMRFLAEYAKAYAEGGTIFGEDARRLYSQTTLYLAPMINPDGVDLVTGAVRSGGYYDNARKIAEAYGGVPFPSGWKANIEGIDLNLQYPAGWEKAGDIKRALGYISPAPRDYAGTRPLEAPEARAVYEFTRRHRFSLTLSYHTQGEVIYWKYGDRTPANAGKLAKAFERVSGYKPEDAPPASANAGYKDWFVEEYGRPGFTIEAGEGKSPLPASRLEIIYRKNLGILTLGLYAATRVF
jgi:g-D-glutamyl-meso-diaminopimelate peptidase